MRQLIFIVLGILAVSARVFADPAPIADIHTMQDLRDAKPIHVSDDWDIRLGISDGGDDAGPWGAIYCLAESKTDARLPSGQTPGAHLGPVFLRWDYSEKHLPSDKMMDSSAERNNHSDSGLYCMAIPLAWAGVCHVEVMAQSGDVLATKDIKVESPRPCYWAEFAEISKSPGGYPCIACRDAHAGMIQFSEGTQILGIDQCKADATANALPGAVPLTGGWFNAELKDEKFPLDLSLKDGTFIIHSRTTKLVNWADDFVLARWWVNNKLVEAPRAQRLMLKQKAKAVSMTDDLTITAGIPDYLGELHAGDMVGIQVLYSPADYQCISPRPDMLAEMISQTNTAFPLESNRLDIKITPQVLANRSPATRPAK